MSITRPNIVIVGAGIHGAATAFYLSKMGWNSIIIESSEVASAASGKSGGFLAKNWGSEFTKQLHEVSFEMHNALAEELQIESYRRITTLEVNCQRKGKNIASWLDRKVSSQIMDTETAQVTPKELTIKLLNQAIQNGSQLIIDTVQGIKIQNNKVRGVQLHHNQFIEAERVMLCMGPWSGVACEDWFNLPIPLTGIKSTSIVYRDLEEIKSEPYACFCTEDSNDCHLELYSRVGGELYVCGCGGSDYVTGDRLRPGGDCASSDLIKPNQDRVNAATKSLSSMTSLGEKSPSVTQACMRPCTDDGLPVMGAVPNIEGAYVSFGHNCWGILWAPVCGLAMAELIVEGTSRCVDISPFTPNRYMMSLTGSRERKKGGTLIKEKW